MKTSEQIDKLAEALSKAQGVFQNPEKNKTATIPMKAGGKYSYAYADLPESLNVTRKALSDNGLSHVCTITYVGDEGIPMLLGRLLHSSGQWIESEFLLPNSPDPKQIASVMTYGRRYLFNALTGIAADDDIDAGEDNVEYKQKASKPIDSPVAYNNTAQPRKSAVVAPRAEKMSMIPNKVSQGDFNDMPEPPAWLSDR